eukprot:m.812233 g.812233  ORF g.812233 m.812233 type:complete len:337 (-) comp23390_c0_seq52:3587-4597(-)
MCGIACVIRTILNRHLNGNSDVSGSRCSAASECESEKASAVLAELARLSPSLQRRGPDGTHCTNTSTAHGEFDIGFQGCVLHLRGEYTSQPMQDHDSNTLLWNGEAYAGVDGLDNCANDTAAVFKALQKAVAAESTLEAHLDEHRRQRAAIARVLSDIRGPWAFVFWHQAHQRLWFGRDFFGRRSLVWRKHIGRNNALVGVDLASTAPPPAASAAPGSKSIPNGDNMERSWEEVPATGIYYIDFARVPAGAHASIATGQNENADNAIGMRLEHVPWCAPTSACATSDPASDGPALVKPVGDFNATLPPPASTGQDGPLTGDGAEAYASTVENVRIN